MTGSGRTSATEETAAAVLVVEDDEAVRTSIQWTLEDEGLEVAAASDGQEAIDRAALRQPDLVLLDIGLPGVDGYGVAAALHARYGRSVPIVVVTADGRAAEKARRVGAVAYLHKPFDLDQLVGTVRAALRLS